ncbi:helix-turn-helix transcriptional regulator [Clostridium felsineum]|uniref:HTH cro/C1-type domain-containing protein n=1 Tax=Clostridium felsineum TaxID=36839 RepID=A0A1S8LSE9_9CLOT|nr:helix-turn-helix transcriptional regulator [Clostridium felsineum]URZ02309.1 hypothetical protein CLAUR_023060 [Clostridium felsineum]URZ04936.1 hypothetical protein CLROS_002600 [Clostridium felsineum]URZ09977.1 hypothetical protein CROST_006850 [Clostridium felsineum]
MIMTVGEKIKELRSKYDLNQDEIVGNELTRNLISQIEHGKANLTRKTAELIIRNTSSILKQRGITLDKSIDVDYLLESEESQAQKIISKYIDDLKDASFYKDTRFNTVLKSVDDFLVTWDFPDLKIKICEIAGDYFTSKNDYYKASVYYENVRYLINNEIDSSKLISILRKLSVVYYYMGKYKEGIDICKYALDRFNEMDSNYKTIFTFNMGLYYNYLGQYENALSILDNFKTKTKDIHKETYNKILLIEASCLQELKRYTEALDYYHKLMTLTPIHDINNRCIYHTNMAQIYIKMNKIDMANKCINTVKSYLSDMSEDFQYLPQIYYELGKAYNLLNDTQNSIYYLNIALNLAKSNKYYNVVSSILNELANLNSKKLPINLKNELMLLSSNSNKIDTNVILNTIKYYTKINNGNAVLELCDFYQNLKKCI